jgi:alpha-tubulin suppressor-like RCC1 family protein
VNGVVSRLRSVIDSGSSFSRNKTMNSLRALLTAQTLFILVSTIALATLQGCTAPPPGCESGGGTLVILNQSGTPVLVTLNPAVGANPVRVSGSEARITARPARYAISVARESDGRVLLGGDVQVACDTETSVTVTAPQGEQPPPEEPPPPPPPPPQVVSTVIHVESDDGVGSGKVVVTAGETSQECREDCAYTYNEGTLLTITADPDPRSVFEGFASGCAGLKPCTFTAQGATEITARFAKANTIQLVSGLHHTCALVNGRVRCWGANNSGQLGVGSIENSSEPDFVTGLEASGSNRIFILGAGYETTCAVIDAFAQGHVAKCWGFNSPVADSPSAWRMLGDPAFDESYGMLPRNIVGLTASASDRISALGGGYSHFCAVVNGEVRCWGADNTDLLGRNPTPSPHIGSPVGLEADVTRVQSGGAYGCARRSGSLRCWGHNTLNQLGHDLVAVQPDAEPVPGIAGSIPSFSTGPTWACAVSNGAVYCWGNDAPGPAVVPGLEAGVTAVGVGREHACAIQEGAIKCWGENGSGQLGLGTPFPSSSPAQVVGLTSGATSLSIGEFYSCAVVNEGVFCWGSNFFGQLGMGLDASRSATPVQVATFKSGTSCTGPGVVTINNTTGHCTSVGIRSPDGLVSDTFQVCPATTTREYEPGIYEWFATLGSPGDLPRAGEGEFFLSCETPQTITIATPPPQTCSATLTVERHPDSINGDGACIVTELYRPTPDGSLISAPASCETPYRAVFPGLGSGLHRLRVYDQQDPSMTFVDRFEEVECNTNSTAQWF